MVWKLSKQKKLQKTLICLLLDRSGSMSGKEEDVVGGVNQFLEKQKKMPDPAIIKMVRFDAWDGKSKIETFRETQSLFTAAPISTDDYQPRGMTPLLDAIGQTLNHLEEDWHKEQPDRAICVIVTDGLENCSKEYNKDQIKSMIEDRQDSDKWSFIYLGADVNAFNEAGSMGIPFQNTACYQVQGDGMFMAFSSAASIAVSSVRSGLSVDNLGGDIDENGQMKNKKKEL
jgi:uncharacterized protein YegL